MLHATYDISFLRIIITIWNLTWIMQPFLSYRKINQPTNQHTHTHTHTYMYICMYKYIFTNLISTSIHGTRKRGKNREEQAVRVSRITARGKKKKYYRSKRKKMPTSSDPLKKSRDVQSVGQKKTKTFHESCNTTIKRVLKTSGANYKINLNRESEIFY